MLNLKRITKHLIRSVVVGAAMLILGTTVSHAINIQVSWGEQFLRSVVDELGQFWGFVFQKAGEPDAFTPPRVQWYTTDEERWGVFEGSNAQTENTPCGRVTIDPALYCPRNHTIYLDIDRIDKRIAEVAQGSNMNGDAVAVFIISHEYAHGVQRMAEIDLPAKDQELQADCFAGFYLHNSKLLQGEADDLDEIAVGVIKAGDYAYQSSSHHGIGMERLEAVMTGLKGDFQGCIEDRESD